MIEQKYKKNGDPINFFAFKMGKKEFLRRIIEEGNISKENSKSFWEDFYCNDNQTFESYLEDI